MMRTRYLSKSHTNSSFSASLKISGIYFQFWWRWFRLLFRNFKVATGRINTKSVIPIRLNGCFVDCRNEIEMSTSIEPVDQHIWIALPFSPEMKSSLSKMKIWILLCPLQILFESFPPNSCLRKLSTKILTKYCNPPQPWQSICLHELETFCRALAWIARGLSSETIK